MAEKKPKKKEPTTAYVELHRITERYRLLRISVTWAGIVCLAFVSIALPFKYGAGKDTTLRYIVDVATNFRWHFVAGGGAVGALIYLWRRERRTGRKAIDREHRRIEELEKKLDPNRASSGFTPKDDERR